MTSNKTTRRALFGSLMSLLLCCSMLVGTTFAWFTAEVKSEGNIIKSGILDVEMTWSKTENGTYADASEGAIFGGDILWEPNHTQTRYIKIENTGNLALKYQLKVIPADTSSDALKLGEVIKVSVDDVEFNTLKYYMTAGASIVGEQMLSPAQSIDYKISLHMDELAGNEYKNLSAGNGFVVQLLATQETYEEDSNGSDYDADAKYPATYGGFVGVTSASGTEVTVSVTQNNADASTATAPVAELATVKVDVALVNTDAEGNGQVSVNIEPKDDVEANVSVAADQAFVAYEITVDGLKDLSTNATPIPVSLYIGTGLTGVEVYHDGTLIASTYDAGTGYVSFATTSFSPFDILFDKVEEEEEIVTMPKAKVTKLSDMPVIDDETTLDTAYTFATVDTVEQAQASNFRYWHADFVVSFDKEIAAETVGLAGQYDAWSENWVYFAVPALTAEEAGAGVRLLKDGAKLIGMSANEIFINYEELCGAVKEFNCGAYVIDESVAADTTMTVELRMYEVKDPSETDNNSWNVETGNYITVGKFTHKF